MNFLLQLAQVTQGKKVYIQDYGWHYLDALLQHIFTLQDPLQWSDIGERGSFAVLDLLQTFFHVSVKQGEAKERIYVNAKAYHAIAVIDFVCTQLIVLPGVLTAKVSGPIALERADNIVIYLESVQAQEAVLQILMPFAMQHNTMF